MVKRNLKNEKTNEGALSTSQKDQKYKKLG